MTAAERVYVGIKSCGCLTAIMVDDKDTTPKEIADFARNMQRKGMRVENMPRNEGIKRLARCTHPRDAK